MSRVAIIMGSDSDLPVMQEAALFFEDYLEEFPRDRSVLREYAVILHWAGRPDATVSVLRRLLGGDDDHEVRLVLARTLRIFLTRSRAQRPPP